MGVTVLDLRRDGPAFVAGLQIGDSIYQLGVQAVNTPADLAKALSMVSAEGTTPVRYYRAGIARSGMLYGVGRTANGKTKRLGIVTDPKLVGSFFKRGVAPKAQPAAAGDGLGVPVLRVDLGSPLATLVRAGDVLLSINGRALSKSEDVAAAVKATAAEALSSVAFRRQGVRRTGSARFGRRADGTVKRLGIVTRPEAL